MKTRTRVWIFGLIAGLIWAIIPGVLLQLFKSFGETIIILLSGAITGFLVSIALYSPLRKLNFRTSFILGIPSLPFGAFVFGVFYSLIGIIITGILNLTDYFAPLKVGILFAFESIVFFGGILFLPAILTTLLLHKVISSEKN